MISGMPDNPEDRLDAYLDGTLGPEARREVRARIADDPALQREVALQARIDESLRRCCRAPDADVLLRKAGHAAPPARSAHGLIRKIARMAAVIVVGVTAVLAVFWFVGPTGRPPGAQSYPLLGMEGSYQALIAAGFQPDWRCETDKEFADTYSYRLGQALVLGQLPAGAEALGLSYSPAFSYNTIALLARVDGEPVVVFADVAGSVDGSAMEFSAPGVNVFRRQIGGIVLFEVTPLDRPTLLDAIHIPEVSGHDGVMPQDGP